MAVILLASLSWCGDARAETPLPAIELSAESSDAIPVNLRADSVWTPDSGLGSFHPEGLARDGLGHLFALDSGRGRIARIDPDGTTRVFGAGDQGGARFAQLIAIFAGSGPDLYALDGSRSVLYRFDLDGRLRNQIAYGADVDLGFIDAVDFALDKSGELLLLDRAGGRLLRFDRFGRFVTNLATGATGSARLQSPTRIDLDGDGEIYVLDPPGRTIRRFSRQGEVRPAWRFDNGLSEGAGVGSQLALTPANQVMVAARDASWIRIFTRDGALLYHQDLAPELWGRLGDLAAGADSLIHLAQPQASRIEHLRVTYGDQAIPGR
ncbi:MAG: hypothetical protein KC729_11450 [Candidatus Eisenbacteria bacterium]|uniref:6-bladed beta-propeller n=1 Tax=Eiseniibacteriota bacterium TaxID=2212470 RepID=A0A956RP66_UNCEI|nr:hypothetical protein [Candidatus Eisenbacteria bacterium]